MTLEEFLNKKIKWFSTGKVEEYTYIKGVIDGLNIVKESLPQWALCIEMEEVTNGAK